MMQQEKTSHKALSPHMIVIEKLDAIRVSYALQAVAHYNIATLIGDGRKTAAELAKETGTQEIWIIYVLSLLAANDIFNEVAPSTFENTILSACLRDDIPGSLRAAALLHGSERMRLMWGKIEECMRTGKNAIELLYGADLYTYFDTHPEEEAVFNAAMTGFSQMANRSIVTHYDFSHIHRLVDVGGGNGSLLEMILSDNPTISGVLFDRPSVIDQVRIANEKSEPGNVSYELVAGSFFESIPPQADAYLLKYILHNWNDEQCRDILQNCRRGMHSSSSILICEQLVISGNKETESAKGVRLLMALQHEGYGRTQEEFSALLETSGLRLVRTIPTDSPIWILEAVLQ